MSFEKQLYPPEIGMSPEFAMLRFKGALQKYGLQQVRTEAMFQKAREMWATAAFLIGVSKLTNKTYWLAPEYDSQTPDTYGISFAPHPRFRRGNVREVLDIEISEYEEHASGDFVQTVAKKLQGKAYPPYTILVIYVHRPGEKLMLKDAHQQLRNQNFSVAEVFLVGSTSTGRERYLYTVASVYPEITQVEFVLEDELNRPRVQSEMIKWSRGFGDAENIAERALLKLPDL